MVLHQGRLYLYQLLKLLYEQPLEPQSLQALHEQPGFKEFSQISSGARSILDYLETNKHVPFEVVLQELRSEYQRLFLGPGPILVPIWESVYFDPEGLLFGERTLEVREFYRKYHLESVHKNSQPEDHLAVELEFMIYLINQYLTNENQTQRNELLLDQKAFFQKHLGTWKDEFFQLSEKHCQNQFYRGSGLLLKEFLDLENEMFEKLEEAF